MGREATMDTSNLREGMVVYSSEGERLGKIIRLDASDFVIEKGFFFPKDFLCSYSNITNVRGDEVYLDVDKQQLKAAQEQLDTEREGETTATSEYGSTRAGATSSTADYGAMRAGTQEETRIPVVEEELTAEKRSREAGAVRVSKDVTVEEKEFTVPVTREEVTVERVPASRAARPEAGEASFQEGTTTIPIREEEVKVRKRPVVREEVRVRRDEQTEERRVADTARKENIDIDETGDTTKKYE